MNPASDWTRDEYTLVRTESRALTDEEQAELQCTIRRYRRSGIALAFAGWGLFAAALALAYAFEAASGWVRPVGGFGCLLGLLLGSTGFRLLSWISDLRADSKLGKVLGFALPGTEEGEARTLEILEQSGRIWRWEGGPLKSLPAVCLRGGIIRRATEVGVRHVEPRELTALMWRELPSRLVKAWLLIAFLLLGFGKMLFGDAYEPSRWLFLWMPTWLFAGFAGIALGRGLFSMHGWWRQLAFHRDLAERVALCFRGEYIPQSAKLSPRSIAKEVLLHSGKTLGFSPGEPEASPARLPLNR